MLNHSSIYYLGLILMAIGLPLSNFLMSIAQFVLVVNWFWEGNIPQKFRQFRQNKSAVILSSVFLLHILGLAYTTDFGYALNDIRIKLPLFILPLIISSSNQLSEIKFKNLMLFFVFAVLAGTIASMSELSGFNNYIRGLFDQPTRQLPNIRGISLFISHIRFSLCICMAIFILVYFVCSHQKKLEELKESAEKEKYFDDVKEEYAALKTKIFHNKREDLKTFNDEISKYLKEEIAARYYFQKGRIEASLSTDSEIQKAIEILNDSVLYASVLKQK